MKRTIKFVWYHERPATQVDVDEQALWLREHPGTACLPTVLGELIDVEDEVEIPAVWEICDRCEGEGHHTNPNIDGDGISMDEWWGPDWDEESRETYMSGGYDVACEAGCSGGLVLVPDEDSCKGEPFATYLRAYRERQARDAEWAREDRVTRYYESGGAEGRSW